MSDGPMLRVLRFVGLGRAPVLWSLTLGALGALSALGLAALSAWLITRAWQMPPVLYLAVAVTAVRALGISRALFRYLERLATHDLALDSMARARERIYQVLASGSPGYSVTLRRSDLLARTADDIDDVGNALIRGLIPMGVAAVTATVAVVIMAVVSPPAAVVLAVALVVSGVLAPWLAARGSAAVLADGARARARSAAAVTSLLWHGPELAVAGRRGVLLDEVIAADRAAAAATDTGMRWQALAKAATPLAVAASTVAAAIIGIALASTVPGSLAGASSHDAVTPMLFGVLLLLPLSAFESTGPLTEAGIAWERGRQAAARVMTLVDGAGVPAEAADPVFAPGPVELTAAGLRWGWDTPLGSDGPAGFALAAGDRLVVAGPSGSGKSTLLLTLAGLLPPLAGTVQATGPSGDVPLRRAVGYFAEEGHIFATTLFENLRVANGGLSTGEARAALVKVGLGGWLDRLPDGVDTDLPGGAESLSGGQRRRLLIARAVVHPAPVVLLDEPLEHLDAADAADLMRAIITPGGLFAAGRTVVVVTHAHAELAPPGARFMVGHRRGSPSEGTGGGLRRV